MRAGATDHAFTGRNACAIDYAVNAAKRRGTGVDCGLHAGFIGHIGFDEFGVRTERVLRGNAGVFVDVGDDDAAAIVDDHFCGCGTETGATAGDEKNGMLDLHDFLFH